MDKIYKAFIAFLKTLGDGDFTDDNIWRVNQNAGEINPPCVIVSIHDNESDSTNIIEDSFVNDSDPTKRKYTHTQKRISSVRISLDFYGPNSFDMATEAGVAFEDPVNFDIFKNNDIIPVESSEPMQLPFIGQDAMDYDRFKIDCIVNFNPTTTKTTDFSQEIEPEVKRVQNIQ